MPGKSNHTITYILRIKDQITKTANRINKAVSGSKQAIKKASASASASSTKAQNNIQKAWAKIASSVRGAGSKVSASVKNFTGKFKEAGKEAGIFNGRIGSMVAKFGPMAAIIAGVALAFTMLASGIKASWEAGIAFEQAQAKLGAITEASTVDLAKMEQQAKFLGETTAFTATQSTEAFTEMAKLGLKTNDIIASSSAVLNLASASGNEMAVTAETMVSTLKQFGLSASESTRVSDVMAKSFTSTALDLNKFGEAMKYAGPVAKSTGVSLTQTTGALGVLADRAIAGSQAGTGLRKIMLYLNDSTSKVGQRLVEAGKFSGTFTDKLRALRDMQLDASEVTDMFGLLATTQAQVLIENADSVDQLTRALDNSAGSAKRMAERMLDTSEGAMKLFDSRLEGVKLQLFSTFGDEGKTLIQFFTEKLEAVANIVSDNAVMFQFWGTVIAETIKGATNFFLSLVDVVQGVINAIVVIITGSAGLMLAPFQFAVNKIIDAWNWLAEKMGKKPITGRITIASTSLEKASFYGKQGLDNFADAGYRMGTGRERRTASGSTAVNVIAKEKLAQSASLASSEENMASLLGGAGGTGNNEDKEREQAIKKAVELEKSLRSELDMIGKTDHEKAISRINAEYDANKQTLSYLEQNKEALALNEKMRMTEISELRKEQAEKSNQYALEMQNKLRLAKLEQQGLDEEADMLRLDEKYLVEQEKARNNAEALLAIKQMREIEETRIQQKYADQRAKIAEREAQQRLQAGMHLYSSLGDLMVTMMGKNKQSARLAQGIATGEAIMNTYVGANKALASAPPPVNFISASAVIASGLANVMKIQQQKFASGGIVGGTSYSGDKVNALVNSGEMILNKSQQRELFKVANGRGASKSNSNATVYGGNVSISVGAGTDPEQVRSVVEGVIQEQNIKLAEQIRRNQEYGVTA